MPEWTVKTDAEETSTPVNPPGAPVRQPDKQTGRRARVWAIVVLVIIAAGGFLHYQHQAAEEEQRAKANEESKPVPVTTTTASKGEMGIYVEALGTVTPVYTVTVTSRVQGQIMEVHYKEGQMVHKGDPLLEIDPRPYEASLTQVEGQLAHDQATLAEARIDLDRYKSAFARNAIAQQQVYDQEQAVLQ